MTLGDDVLQHLFVGDGGAARLSEKPGVQAQSLTLRVPRLRDGSFSPERFARDPAARASLPVGALTAHRADGPHPSLNAAGLLLAAF
jgi:transposase-like protein